MGNVAVYTDTGIILLPIIPEVPVNQWRHVALICKSGESHLLIDGRPLGGENRHNYRYILPPETLYIGRGYQGKRYFKGDLAEVRLWNRALDPSEIQAKMQQSLIGNEPGLVGYWPLNDGSGAIAAAPTNQEHQGTISGATWIASGVTHFTTSSGIPTPAGKLQTSIRSPSCHAATH